MRISEGLGRKGGGGEGVAPSTSAGSDASAGSLSSCSSLDAAGRAYGGFQAAFFTYSTRFSSIYCTSGWIALNSARL